MLLRAIVFLSLFGSAATAAAQSDARQPTGKWIVNFADAQCLAIRDYGRAEQPLRLVLKAPAVGEVMQVAVFRPAGKTDPDQIRARVAVDDGPVLGTNLMIYTPKGTKERAYLLNMPAADFERVRSGKELTIRAGSLDEAFLLSDMEPLLKVMDECVADLRRVFNISDARGEAPQGLERRAKTNLSRYIDDGDYPNVSISRGDTGATRFALLIDETGHVVDCTVVETSGAAALDGQACAIMQNRARFRPALDRDGKPAKDAVISRIVWKMAH